MRVRRSARTAPGRRARRFAAVALGAATLLAAGGCERTGPGSVPASAGPVAGVSPNRAAGDPPAGVAPDRLAGLRALGYVDWDENPDPELSGVTRHDPGRSMPGYSLFTNDDDEVYLEDLRGNRVHTWRLPDREECEYAELLADGRLLVVCVGSALVLLDHDSTLLFETRLPVHHDVAALPDGSFLAPVFDRAYDYQERLVRFDGIAHVSPDGELLGRWLTHDHFDDLREHHRPSALDQPPEDEDDPTRMRLMDYYHLNTVEVLPDTELGRRDPRFRAGNLLVCFRNVDTIMILDGDTREVVWSWGPGVLEQPHMPTLLEDGTILVYDNGPWRGHTRILELDPTTGEIVWTYEASPPGDFLSRTQGSNQRLGNGNTLICESERGHAFEVTPEGEVVWEFWNPELVDGKRRGIYRLVRVDDAHAAGLLARRGDLEATRLAAGE